MTALTERGSGASGAASVTPPRRKRRRRSPVWHHAEYWAWRAAIGVLAALPIGVARAVGARIGTLGYSPLRIRRALVERHLELALPELDAPARARIARDAYAHLGQLAVEAAALSTRAPAALQALFHPPTGWELLERARANGRNVIVVSGHLGNWELGVAYISARGVPQSVVARHMGNPLFEEYVVQARARLGISLIPEREAVPQIPHLFRAGRIVTMLADQGAKGLSATFAPFFGRLARTPRGPALLALRHKAVVLLMVVPREADGRYRVCFEPVEVERTGDRDADVNAIVARYTAQIEAWVRRYPEQYLWHHRRWRRRPDGTFEDV